MKNKKMVRFIDVIEIDGIKYYMMKDEHGGLETGFAIEKSLINHAEKLKWAYRSEVEITDNRTGKKLEIENGSFIWN